MKEIDARGLACPAPVLQTKAALEEDGLTAVSVLVDNEAAMQNVTRFLESRQYHTKTDDDDGNFIVTASRDATDVPQEINIPEKSGDTETHTRIMVMIASDRMGRGDDDLGDKLVVNFIRTLKEMGPDLWRLVFINSGVKLSIDGSPALADLQELEAGGVSMLICGTCLDHFDILSRKQVGETTNMLDIITSMQLADKVINI